MYKLDFIGDLNHVFVNPLLEYIEVIEGSVSPTCFGLHFELNLLDSWLFSMRIFES